MNELKYEMEWWRTWYYASARLNVLNKENNLKENKRTKLRETSKTIKEPQNGLSSKNECQQKSDLWDKWTKEAH